MADLLNFPLCTAYRGPSLLSGFLWFVRYLAASGNLGSFPALHTPSSSITTRTAFLYLRFIPPFGNTSLVYFYIYIHPRMDVAFLKRENFALLRSLLTVARFEYVAGTGNGCLYSKSIVIKSIFGQGGQGQPDPPSSMALHCLRSPIALSPSTNLLPNSLSFER